MTEKNQGPYPKAAGMEFAHPLFIIPFEYWYDAERKMQCSPLAFYGDGVVRLYTAPDDLDDMLVQSDIDGDDFRYCSEFRTVYTATAEEVCRALRGPQGYTGPTGAMGDPGRPAEDYMAAMYNRLADAERGTTAAMKAITSLVTTLTNTGVIGADTVLNNDPKEQ